MKNKLEELVNDDVIEVDSDIIKAVLEVDGSEMKFMCEGQCDIEKVK